MLSTGRFFNILSGFSISETQYVRKTEGSISLLISWFCDWLSVISNAPRKRPIVKITLSMFHVAIWTELSVTFICYQFTFYNFLIDINAKIALACNVAHYWSSCYSILKERSTVLQSCNCAICIWRRTYRRGEQDTLLQNIFHSWQINLTKLTLS